MGGLLEKSTIRLTQPSLAGTGAELGNNDDIKSKCRSPSALWAVGLEKPIKILKPCVCDVMPAVQ